MHPPSLPTTSRNRPRPRLTVPALALVLLTVLLAGALEPGCSPRADLADTVDGYVALVPRVLRAGEAASFAFTLFDGEELAGGPVSVSLRDGGSVLAEASARVGGKGTVRLDVPAVEPGEYQVVVTGPGFTESAQVQVREGTVLFLETDKPIYKPGQTVLVRLIALDSELRPAPATAVVDIQDATGVKVFKRVVSVDEYGTATLELPLSAEPNLGVWKIRAVAGDATTEIDVRVEEYVLPKYEVKAELSKDWFLVDEPITGRATAGYSFGRPVRGELRITASRYVGVWEEFATYSTTLDGEADFRIDPPGYVAGVPEAGGQGNVTLELSVKERGTGYEESTSALVTVAAAPVAVKLISESASFKPGLPFDLLLVTETPAGRAVEASVALEVQYYDEDYAAAGRERSTVETRRGTALVGLSPPQGAASMQVSAVVGDAYAYRQIGAAYSPSDSYVHVEQVGGGALRAGDTARFQVAATSGAPGFYYEVVARDRVVFTGTTSAAGEIAFRATPAMAPGAKLLVYQILPTSEVAADALPFSVEGEYPLAVSAAFGAEEVRPGDPVEVRVQTGGRAKVGLVAVDRSVFMLAENRLNLQQVFAELERLYMQPQAELHEAEPMFMPVTNPGAEDVFRDAGLIVLSDKRVPEGRRVEDPLFLAEDGALMGGAGVMRAAAATSTTAAASTEAGAREGLAEVERVRRFFPETWIWQEVVTDGDGTAALQVEAPDSITTWDLRAVALSPDKGLGMAETSLRVFQPFFLTADLPYSAVRGEEFPVKVALYNYLDTAQEFFVELESSPWFDLLDDGAKTVTVAGNDTAGVEFVIRPRTLGTQVLEITARSAEAADAVRKSMIVEPEGVARETVENAVVKAGDSRTLRLLLPGPMPQGGPADDPGPGATIGAAPSGDTVEPAAPLVPSTRVVPDSARAYVAVTGSLLAQTIDGLEGLLQMPFGCGEQNMILFAPDAYILRYLEESRQLKPEIQARAEMLLTTGYQRELTYRRDDGSFSAFGSSDPEGSLFLTAFVLKTFAQAKDLTYVDEAVLADAGAWIESRQKADGSFDPVGFVAHEEMMGGIRGTDALTAYVAVALLEAGQTRAAEKAVGYVEGRLDAVEDPYSLALAAYALELGGSASAADAYERLLAAVVEDEDGLHWSGGALGPGPLHGEPGVAPGEPVGEAMPPKDGMGPTLDIEATGYAALALIEHGDRVNAGRAARWLVGRRNSLGGYSSTQDTVVALQALTRYASAGSSDTDLTVTVEADDVRHEVRVTPENYDVTQVVEVPAGASVRVDAEGRGEAVVQGVLRYNIEEPEAERGVFDIRVDYGTSEVEVDDLVDVDVSVTFSPPEPLKAGMVVLDVSVPTGFAPVTESLDRVLERPNIKRYDVAGRKVILYIEDMAPGETVSFGFQVKAVHPVRGKGSAAEAYSYYTPSWDGETVSPALTVRGL